mmetsp:Transcript_88565/g.225439  ORF Transcript_88565/g.225439 Transcript_88565/m.225439 type:complete len:389 (+) Transcript_88565:57-1223(+)
MLFHGLRLQPRVGGRRCSARGRRSGRRRRTHGAEGPEAVREIGRGLRIHRVQGPHRRAEGRALEVLHAADRPLEDVGEDLQNVRVAGGSSCQQQLWSLRACPLQETGHQTAEVVPYGQSTHLDDSPRILPCIFKPIQRFDALLASGPPAPECASLVHRRRDLIRGEEHANGAAVARLCRPQRLGEGRPLALGACGGGEEVVADAAPGDVSVGVAQHRPIAALEDRVWEQVAKGQRRLRDVGYHGERCVGRPQADSDVSFFNKAVAHHRAGVVARPGDDIALCHKTVSLHPEAMHRATNLPGVLGLGEAPAQISCLAGCDKVEQLLVPLLGANVHQIHAGGVRNIHGRHLAEEQRGAQGADQRQGRHGGQAALRDEAPEMVAAKALLGC